MSEKAKPIYGRRFWKNDGTPGCIAGCGCLVLVAFVVLVLLMA